MSIIAFESDRLTWADEAPDHVIWPEQEITPEGWESATELSDGTITPIVVNLPIAPAGWQSETELSIGGASAPLEYITATAEARNRSATVTGGPPITVEVSSGVGLHVVAEGRPPDDGKTNP